MPSWHAPGLSPPAPWNQITRFRATPNRSSSAQFRWLSEVAQRSHKGVSQAIIPVPGELDTSDRRASLWGVKSDVYPPDTPENDVRGESKIHVLEIEPWADGGGSIFFECETAWDPPYKILENLHSRGFDVSCFYSEPNMNFSGEWQNGSDVQHECRFWPIPAYATRHMQEACSGIIRGKALLVAKDGAIQRFEPESSGVLEGRDAIFGRPSYDLDGLELDEWQTLYLDEVEALFPLVMRSRVLSGPPGNVSRPPFATLYATTEAYRLNYEPLVESAEE